MSKTLTFEVPDELYEAFEQLAAKQGRTPEEVAAERLARDSTSRMEKLAAMEEAAKDELFLADLNEVMEDFAQADAESHPT